MRDCQPQFEQAFFALFQDYYDFERTALPGPRPGEYSLARMMPLVALAGHPERRVRVLHVAGTKGKGSVCHLLCALLVADGRHVGMFTSPHLATVRERFRLDGELIDYASLLAAGNRFARELQDAQLQPSLFEIMTLLSMRLFAEAGCEFAILETGIGGLLDATNYVPAPECCVITPVSLDHAQLLGPEIADIARQKAGIIKPGVPLVCARQPFPDAAAVIRDTAARQKAPFFEAAPPARVSTWTETPLPPFQKQNLGTALQVCAVLGIEPDPVRFRMPELRARCECICKVPLVLLDAAHNAHSAQELVRAVKELYPGTHFTLVLGIVKHKDVAGIYAALRELSSDFIFTHPHTPKPSALPELLECTRHDSATVRVTASITSLDDLPAGRNLLFTGSFFTALIGEKLFQPGHSAAR